MKKVLLALCFLAFCTAPAIAQETYQCDTEEQEIAELEPNQAPDEPGRGAPSDLTGSFCNPSCKRPTRMKNICEYDA